MGHASKMPHTVCILERNRRRSGLAQRKIDRHWKRGVPPPVLYGESIAKRERETFFIRPLQHLTTTQRNGQGRKKKRKTDLLDTNLSNL